MGKTALILAQMIVFAAVVLAAMWVGIQMGRRREAAAREGISTQWARDVTNLLRDLLTPPKSDAMASDFVVLPQPLKSKAHQLLAAAQKAGVTRRWGR